MKTRTISFCLGLTITTVISSLPAKAASINFDDLQLIPVRPINSNNFLSFSGEPDENQGQTAFFNLDPSAPDSGHLEISKNSPPGNIAPYYATGRQSSPEQSNANRSGTLDGVTGFTNFFQYLNGNSINFHEIGFGYGQKNDRAFTETWNLGDDLLGQDWLASPDSTIEERIYQANPDAVESFLVINNTKKFINFGYSPLYAIFDQGATQSITDNTDIFLTQALMVQKVADLDPLTDGLANAFLLDVNLHGGKVQLVVEDSAVEDPTPIFDPDTGYVIVNFPLPLTLRTVQVPEPSAIGGLFLVGTLGTLFNKRRQN